MTTRIEFVWPKKGLIPSRGEKGDWVLMEPSPDRPHHSLRVTSHISSDDSSDEPSLVIQGERLNAISVLRKHLPRIPKLIYLDLPRVEVDDKSRAFRGEGDALWSSYLCVAREHIRAASLLLARDGVLIAQCGDSEAPYVRLILEEVMGRDNNLGTVMWQRSYSPRNMKGMKEFTVTHEPLMVFASDKESLQRVALPRAPEGYGNPNDDPRGDWRAVRQKGSATRRDKTDFAINIPPYRWSLVSEGLPPGIWRISPLTGVVWGVPSVAGDFKFQVEVSDSSGQTARKTLSIEIRPDGQPECAEYIPWMFDADDPPAGSPPAWKWTGVSPGSQRPRVSTRKLPFGVVGQSYSAVVLATNGQPFEGKARPSPPRYYEFTWERLLRECLNDRVDFGKKGDAVPRLVSFLREAGEVEYVNQQTWWPGSVVKKSDWSKGEDEGVGFTEDATKHLEGLRSRGLIKEAVKTAKPELLLDRLVQIFTRPKDTVVELFGEAADLSIVALKTGRRFVYLAGSTEHETSIFADCALPRIGAVVAGDDLPADADDGSDTKKAARSRARDIAVPYQGGGNILVAEIATPVAEWRRGEDAPYLNHAAFSGTEGATREMILTSEGYLPVGDESGFHGRSFDGRRYAVVLDPSEFLDRARAARLCTSAARAGHTLVVYYFRSSDDFDPNDAISTVTFRRLPMGLTP